MDETPKRLAEKPRGIAILALSHLVLGAVCLFVLMAYGLVVDFWEAVGLGFAMMFVGGLTTGVLTHLNPRFRWLWIASFSILPFVYVVPSIIRFMEIGDQLPMTYWTTFSLGVACTCYIGSVIGEGYEMWNRFRQPTRGRFRRTLTRWLS